MSTTYFICILKKLNLSLRSFEKQQLFKSAAHEHDLFYIHFKKLELEPAIVRKVETCQRITSRKHSNSVGRYLSPRYGQSILVSRNTILTAVN